jgi:hypothetical protein
VAAVVVLAVLAMGSLVQGRQDATRREARRLHGVAAADAAIAETLARLAEDRHFHGIASRPFGGGEIRSAVTPKGTDTVEVVAVGSWGGLSVRITAAVDVAGRPTVLSWDRGFGRVGGS